MKDSSWLSAVWGIETHSCPPQASNCTQGWFCRFLEMVSWFPYILLPGQTAFLTAEAGTLRDERILINIVTKQQLPVIFFMAHSAAAHKCPNITFYMTTPVLSVSLIVLLHLLALWIIKVSGTSKRDCDLSHMFVVQFFDRRSLNLLWAMLSYQIKFTITK